MLMRCRAFLKRGVSFKVVVADAGLRGFVDSGRLAQIVTNGMRFVLFLQKESCHFMSSLLIK